jgi:Legume lectin domain/Chitobiase/beta-hexosaminidase C-terminal domain
MQISSAGQLESFGRERESAKRHRWIGSMLMLGWMFAVSLPAQAQTNVLTQHNDIARTGQNTNETVLTPSSVNSTTFGKLFSHPVDGYVYTQPLYVAGVTLGAGTAQAGTTHNMFFVATENDTVYAFDADSNGGANASALWQASMIASAHGAGAEEKPMPNSDVSTTDIVPQIGITSTPVIDPSTNTMYLVAKSTVADTTFIQRLHAIDITTGQEKFGGPTTLAASVPGNGNGSSGGTLNWDPKWQNNRVSLLLLNGIVYIGFGSHGDNGPWHGWILAYNAASLQQTSAYCTTPNGAGSGIWGAGSGLAADLIDPVNQPFGRMFVSTGNGSYDATTPYTNNMDYGDDHLHLDLTDGVVTVVDSFTPQNQAALDAADQDVGSGGVLLLPNQTSGGHTHLLVQVGKEGKIYLVDRDAMGGYSTTSDNDVQEIAGQTGGLWSMPAYWNNMVYFWGRFNNLQAFSLTAGKLSATPVATGADGANFPGATPSISSNGTSNAIVWALQTDSFGSDGPAILRAYNATNVATELYNSEQNSSRDAAGQAVKFAVPTIVNGKVYVGAAEEVDVYGLLAGSPTVAAPVINPASESFTGTVSVTITDSTNGATIYYTTDGSTPTTSSLQYSGAISVSTTETISAIGSATGSLTSPVVTQSYKLQTQTLMPTFSPPAGSYATAQNVTISDATVASKIYYTTDGTTPSPGAGTTQLYFAPITVGASQTISAVATDTNLSNSPVASSTYAINLGASGLNFSNGFSTAAPLMTFNGSTDLDDTRLQLTTGVINQAGSAFYNTALNIHTFTTDFTMQLSNPGGDGLTFTIQGDGPTALGPSGGGLGYGPDLPTKPDPSPNPPIANSVAVKFDIFSNAGEGENSTGLYTNGASPTIPAIDLTPSGIDLHSGDTMSVHLQYDGTNLALTITDSIANATFTNSWPVNIPAVVGGKTAYVGFTGATGGQASSLKIETWTFTATTSTQAAGAATPIFTPPAGAYASPQEVTITDVTPGSTIYYTMDGSTPTASSTQYSSAVSVTSSVTLKAIAALAGGTDSGVATAAYVIGTTDFTLSSGSSTLTIAKGGQGTDTITIAPMNGSFANPVQLTCAVTGPAPLPTCTLSPTSVTPGTQPATSMLTVMAPTVSAMVNPSINPSANPSSSPQDFASLYLTGLSVSLLAWTLLAALKEEKRVRATPSLGSFRHPCNFKYAPVRMRKLAWLSVVLLLALWQASCGGGSLNQQSPLPSAPQNYTVTVTAAATTTTPTTSTIIQRTAQLTVTIP